VPDALIGHTGFVGGNFLRQRHFDDLFNSKNIQDIRGRAYELLVVSGAPAEKWKANAEPERDLAILNGLMEHLRHVTARKVVLISTVDVYPKPLEVDEDTPFDATQGGAYGRNRYLLEQFVQERFDACVVRLPGLFGQGLKKNVIYDFLNNNRTEVIHSEGVFQFYDLANLARDVQTAQANGLRVVNFSTEPTRVGDIIREGFGITFDNKLPNPPARYDMRSKHAALFGGKKGYLYDARQVFDGVKTFVAQEKARKAGQPS
jgi:nucleoside-diphosphate-sugar epimerase